MKRTLSVLGAALAIGYLFALLRIPVPWLLGPLVAGVGATLLGGGPQPFPGQLILVGQAILGLSGGAGFPLQSVGLVWRYGVPLLGAVIVTGSLSMLNGYLLGRWAGIDQATGFVGSLPGAAPSMVAMSTELGADALTVAILQYLRLLLVLILAPPALSILFPETAASGLAAAAASGPAGTAPVLLNLLALAAAGVAGVWGGARLGLPSPAFLGSFLAALGATWAAPFPVTMPAWVAAVGMVLVGTSIGLKFDPPNARKLGRVALIQTGLVLLLIVMCLGVGYGFHLLTGVDAVTAVLGSTPGGMDVMTATAAALGADPGLVVALHMTRWLIILLAGPWITTRLIRG